MDRQYDSKTLSGLLSAAKAAVRTASRSLTNAADLDVYDVLSGGMLAKLRELEEDSLKLERLVAKSAPIQRDAPLSSADATVTNAKRKIPDTATEAGPSRQRTFATVAQRDVPVTIAQAKAEPVEDDSDIIFIPTVKKERLAHPIAPMPPAEPKEAFSDLIIYDSETILADDKLSAEAKVFLVGHFNTGLTGNEYFDHIAIHCYHLAGMDVSHLPGGDEFEPSIPRECPLPQPPTKTTRKGQTAISPQYFHTTDEKAIHQSFGDPPNWRDLGDMMESVGATLPKQQKQTSENYIGAILAKAKEWHYYHEALIEYMEVQVVKATAKKLKERSER